MAKIKGWKKIKDGLFLKNRKEIVWENKKMPFYSMVRIIELDPDLSVMRYEVYATKRKNSSHGNH